MNNMFFILLPLFANILTDEFPYFYNIHIPPSQTLALPNNSKDSVQTLVH